MLSYTLVYNPMILLLLLEELIAHEGLELNTKYPLLKYMFYKHLNSQDLNDISQMSIYKGLFTFLDEVEVVRCLNFFI